jgi:hypothetical protein
VCALELFAVQLSSIPLGAQIGNLVVAGSAHHLNTDGIMIYIESPRQRKK